MLALRDLQTRAQSLRQQPLTQETRAQLEGLRQSAAHSGPVVAQAFDKQLQALFGDVYGGQPPPPVSLTSAGPAQTAGHGGARSAALQFHQLHRTHQARARGSQSQSSPEALAKEVAAKIPALQTSTAPPVPLAAQFPPLSAADKRAARRALEAELSGVQVKQGGARISVLEKLSRVPGLSEAQRERVLDTLAEVKVGYERAGGLIGDKPGGHAYQDVNWKHTRLEVDRVVDVIAAGRLAPSEAEAALLASILSDAVKAPSNFLVHNVHGAEAALHLLSRREPRPSAELLEDVARATLEHQVGPPSFMANVALRSALKGASVDGAVIGSICDKVSRPFEDKNLTADRSEIAFADVEKAALARVGVAAWTVPHEGSRHYKAARAVIDGDSLVNYACPDGWAKLAALHGPDQPPFLQEPRLVDGLVSDRPEHASAKKSFFDARSVVSPESLALYDSGLERTGRAIDVVLQELDRWVARQPPGDVPRTKDGKVPYLDGDLDYGDAAQVAFARRLRDQAVQLLRQQESL